MAPMMMPAHAMLPPSKLFDARMFRRAIAPMTIPAGGSTKTAQISDQIASSTWLLTDDPPETGSGFAGTTVVMVGSVRARTRHLSRAAAAPLRSLVAGFQSEVSRIGRHAPSNRISCDGDHTPANPRPRPRHGRGALPSLARTGILAQASVCARRLGRSMKRKIAAIMAADIAGYSKLVAEDEEETLRRLGSYRAVFEDFISRFSGRIFNTAGDAVLAEFPSAVEAVRCAIDVQESLRTRNLAYPASRQMSFRIGITIGDVVERDGDLLGDGVNIASRLSGLAQPGGLCVSRTVYEQVANKLSVEFIDIGEQEVKNIPVPIHAYAWALGRDDRRQVLQQKKKSSSAWPVAITAASVAAVAVVGYF